MTLMENLPVLQQIGAPASLLTTKQDTRRDSYGRHHESHGRCASKAPGREVMVMVSLEDLTGLSWCPCLFVVGDPGRNPWHFLAGMVHSYQNINEAAKNAHDYPALLAHYYDLVDSQYDLEESLAPYVVLGASSDLLEAAEEYNTYLEAALRSAREHFRSETFRSMLPLPDLRTERRYLMGLPTRLGARDSLVDAILLSWSIPSTGGVLLEVPKVCMEILLDWQIDKGLSQKERICMVELTETDTPAVLETVQALWEPHRRCDFSNLTVALEAARQLCSTQR